MAILGCTNPNAVNYDPSATEDNGSCIFLTKVNGICYAFQEVASTGDKSFTISYSLESHSWVFYHDYIPDFYIGTRKKLYVTKDSKVYKTNSGPPGLFFDQTTPSPFFIDVVLNYGQDVILDSIQWFSELMDNLGEVDEFATFTHITVWNGQQCTGRLAIKDYVPFDLLGERKTVSQFSFNELRDIVINRSGQFMTDIFSNMRPIDTALNPGMAWFDKGLLQSNYFIVRLEYDNVVAKTLSLHSVDAIVTPTVR